MPIEGIQQAGGGAWPIQEPLSVRPVDGGASILRFGELIRGIVLRLTDQEAVIDLKGSPFTMDRSPGLQEGAEVLVRVTELSPQPVLEVVRPPEQDIEATVVSLIRANLADPIPAEESLANLQQALEVFVAGGSPQAALPSVARLQAFLQGVLASPNAPTTDRVVRLIEDGGLHYEAKLARLAVANAPEPEALAQSDWKGLLLQVQHDLTRQTPTSARSSPELAPGPAPHPEPSTAAGASNASLVSLIDHQLQHLENQQALNLLAQWHGGAFGLEVPVVIHQALATVHLAIEPDARGEPGESEDQRGGYNLLFQMDLDHYGQTKIEAWVAARALRVNFFVEHEAAVGEIRSELPALQQSLRTLGFHEVLLTADLLSRLPSEKQHQFDEARVGIPADVHLLDVEV